MGKIHLIQRIAAVVGIGNAVKFIIRRALGDSAPMELFVGDYVHPVYVRPDKSDMWMMLQVLVGEEYRPAQDQNLRSILDLGGNCGYASVYFAHRFPNARIVCVEPDSDNFGVLVRNLKPYSNVLPINAAAWDSDGWVSLSNPGAESSEFSYSEAAGDSGKVRSISIVNLGKEHGIVSWGLVKMDIEGAEIRLLRVGSAWIPNASILAIEIHDDCRKEAEELLDLHTPGWPVRFKSGETYWRFRSDEVAEAVG